MQINSLFEWCLTEIASFRLWVFTEFSFEKLSLKVFMEFPRKLIRKKDLNVINDSRREQQNAWCLVTRNRTNESWHCAALISEVLKAVYYLIKSHIDINSVINENLIKLFPLAFSFNAQAHTREQWNTISGNHLISENFCIVVVTFRKSTSFPEPCF